MKIVPISLAEANRFVANHHRHSKPTQGHKFSVGVATEQLHGVAIAGRPVARMLDDGFTLEVLRVATDGTPNACSMLYGAVVRCGKAMGYRKIITYTLSTENGASLRASNFKQSGTVKASQWDTPSRRRNQREAHDRIRWEQ